MFLGLALNPLRKGLSCPTAARSHEIHNSAGRGALDYLLWRSW